MMVSDVELFEMARRLERETQDDGARLVVDKNGMAHGLAAHVAAGCEICAEQRNPRSHMVK